MSDFETMINYATAKHDFGKFRAMREEQRSADGNSRKEYRATMNMIKRHFPAYFELAKVSEELRDYCEFVKAGGATNPEEHRDILQRAMRAKRESKANT